MFGNKKRLYLGVYPSGVINNEDRKYHWAFLIGPKSEWQSEVLGVRYYVKNTPFQEWIYEEVPLSNVKNTIKLLARIVIAKIKDENRLIEIFRTTPVVQNDPGWHCRDWMADVLDRIKQDGRAVGTADLDWARVERLARSYVEKKSSDGRYGEGADMSKDKPTWDMLEWEEVIP